MMNHPLLRKYVIAVAALVGLLAGLISPSFAQTDWYYTALDSTPATQVWESKSGAFVSNTSAAYKTFLAALLVDPVHRGYVVSVTGAADNGSGLIRLTLSFVPGGWTTGQYKTVDAVAGTTEANGAWAITVIDSTTVDLQGSAFVHAYTSGGLIGSGDVVATVAGVYAIIDRINLGIAGTGAYGGVATSAGCSTTLGLAGSTFPVADVVNVTCGLGGTVQLPKENVPGAFPLGRKMTFNAQSVTGGNISVVAQDGSTVLGTLLTTGDALTLIPYANTSQNGSWIKAGYWPPRFADLTGSIATAQSSALTGDVTKSAGSSATTLTNIPTGTTQAGTVVGTNIAAPSSPAAAHVATWLDSTDLRLHDKNASGVIGTTIVAAACAANNFSTGHTAAGVNICAQPASTGLSDYAQGTWTPVIVPTTSGSYTQSTQTGTYEKIGRSVTVRFDVTTTAQSSPVGSLSITGLPVASGSSGTDFGYCSVLYQSGLTNSASYTMFFGLILSGSTISIYETGSGQASQAAAVARAAAAMVIAGFCVYHT